MKLFYTYKPLQAWKRRCAKADKMNIFWIYPSEYCDAHMKIILEITQMLWTVWHLSDSVIPIDCSVKVYKKTHSNHPMTIWVGQCTMNYTMAATFGLHLCREKTKRYKKPHLCETILQWLHQNIPTLPIPKPVKKRKPIATAYAQSGNLEGCTPVPLCMPEKYHGERNLQRATIRYMLGEKLGFMRWLHSPLPRWTKEIIVKALQNYFSSDNTLIILNYLMKTI